jgi:TfoX/Sxy family transcriptional regulator of competence genes
MTSNELTERVRAALAEVPGVESKKMFSGIAFLVDGKMCINVTSDGLMCRIDPALHEELVEKPGCRSMVMKGKELKGWVVVIPEMVHTAKALNYWVTQCLAYNSQAKASKKKKRSS